MYKAHAVKIIEGVTFEKTLKHLFFVVFVDYHPNHTFLLHQ